jgi:hypothetical protein
MRYRDACNVRLPEGFRFMTRTPPIRIDQEVIAGFSAMDPCVSGRLLAWGWRCFQGENISLEDEKRKDASSVEALIAGAQFLDPEALLKGHIVVAAFDAARSKAHKLSRTRAKARAVRFENDASTSSEAMLPLHRKSGGAKRGPHGESNPTPDLFSFELPADPAISDPQPLPSGPIHPSCRAAAQCLVEFGMLETEAMATVLRLSEEHHPDAIVSATLRMRGRSMLNPGRYLEKSLQNERQAPSIQPPAKFSAGEATAPIGPQPIRRQTSPDASGKWVFLGWTSEAHPKSDQTQDGRFKVWRTDSGKLSYKRPDIDERPPSFEENPGVYEVD